MTRNVHQILQDTDPLHQLLAQAPEQFVGYAYDIDYGELTFLTNDLWKERVLGIPHNAFLLASALNPALDPAVVDDMDREVLLLRVLGPTTLPQAADLIKTRIEHHQRRTRTQQLPQGRPAPGADEQDGFDWLTRSQLQSSGLRTRIIGTFYLDSGALRLGSDIENYMAMSPLRVYRPCPDALQTIVNHINPEVREKMEREARDAGFARAPSPIEIGTVRYTSTRRLQGRVTRPGNQPGDVRVYISPSDFLARRTAILGMTRTGKSNTVKTTVAAVTLAAMQDGIRVGQLIFDLNGEYANATHQDDGSSIAEVFPEETVRYRAMETAGFQDLRLNFHEDPAGAIQLMGGLYHDETTKLSTAQDIQQLFDLDLSEPDVADHSAHKRWKNHISAFRTLLYAAEIRGGPAWIEVPASADILRQVREAGVAIPKELEPALTAGGERVRLEPDDAVTWWNLLRQANLLWRNGGKTKGRKAKAKVAVEGDDEFSGNNVGLLSTSKKPWVDKALEVLLNTLASENSSGTGFIGTRAVKRYAEFHSPRRSKHLEDEILGHLSAGKIVILDLSVGPTSIRRVLAERVARRVFAHQMKELHSGRSPQNVVLYVEEAHNLIGKKAELDSTWPRIAKEGAKARIAFVYATQEPSSVHPNVLANTENWFVTHLNNDDELKALGKFYDFADFTDSLKVAQDVGFARIKTLSSPFVTPVQILRFTPAELIARKQALQAAARVN